MQTPILRSILAMWSRLWRHATDHGEIAKVTQRDGAAGAFCGYGRPCDHAETLGFAILEVLQIQFIARVSGHSSSPETGTLSAWVWRR